MDTMILVVILVMLFIINNNLYRDAKFMDASVVILYIDKIEII